MSNDYGKNFSPRDNRRPGGPGEVWRKDVPRPHPTNHTAAGDARRAGHTGQVGAGRHD